MDNLEEPECEFTEEKLPSSIFDAEFSKAINISLLEDAYFENKISNIDATWFKNFGTVLVDYYNEKSKKWATDIRHKRCRDLNYYVDYVTDLTIQIAKKIKGKRVDNLQDDIDSMKKNLNSLFTTHGEFNCLRDESTYKTQMHTKKHLDDFCENRDHLIKCVKNKNVTCDNLNKFISDKYKNFFNEKSCIMDPDTKEKKFYYINEKCSFYDIPKTFSCTDCAEYNTPQKIDSIPYCPNYNIEISEEIEEYEHQYVDSTSLVEKIIEYIILLGNFLCSKIIKHKKIKNMNAYISEIPENLSY
ncbi:PIR Superfamily Protein [Plasmodium ovale curtisi]|uniref:PIR Superfamily Protein n=1 Tax=Plasmodium ovale curtisi TaxID=864141 RepID=A0A1A8WEZ1_PLAOA|nr:PIR Superfamily Protein [Plasmodium ovale curtisi]